MSISKQEAKKYILKHWKTSNGKKITEMLKRYWKMDKPSVDAQIEMATKIFYD